MMRTNSRLVWKVLSPRQTDHGVDRVRAWAAESGGLAPEDIFVSTDVDEMLSRAALHQLRWCQARVAALSGALWMPLGR